jgi:hypothetical protein
MKKILLSIIILILLSLINTSISSANSAEPPSILIIVPNAPYDLEITIDPNNIKAGRANKSIESYYTFYIRDLNPIGNSLKVTTNDRTFEIALESPLKRYNNIFTLDLNNQSLTPGKSFTRSITLISLRIGLTLIIEALVFYLFGFRKKKSWLLFLIINLITQVLLNIVINVSFNPLDSYIIISLIFGEILVFIVEIIAFLRLVKEHSELRTGSYVVMANLLSLVAGGYIITILPV